MRTVRLEFINYDAGLDKAEQTTIHCQEFKQVMEWYGAFCAGDDYDVFIDGKPVQVDMNGCYVGPWTSPNF